MYTYTYAYSIYLYITYTHIHVCIYIYIYIHTYTHVFVYSLVSAIIHHATPCRAMLCYSSSHISKDHQVNVSLKPKEYWQIWTSKWPCEFSARGSRQSLWMPVSGTRSMRHDARQHKRGLRMVGTLAEDACPKPGPLCKLRSLAVHARGASRLPFLHTCAQHRLQPHATPPPPP